MVHSEGVNTGKGEGGCHRFPHGRVLLCRGVGFGSGHRFIRQRPFCSWIQVLPAHAFCLVRSGLEVGAGKSMAWHGIAYGERFHGQRDKTWDLTCGRYSFLLLFVF